MMNVPGSNLGPAALLTTLLLLALSCGQSAAIQTPDPEENGTVHPATVTKPVAIQESYDRIGYQLRTVSVVDAAGQEADIPVHIWYPTDAPAAEYVYSTVGEDLRSSSYETRLAVDARVAARSSPYPLVLFFHGAFTCGTQSLFLTEHLAHQGFIVVAPDFPDDLRICGQWGSHDPRVKVLGGLRDIRQSNEEGQLAMLARSQRVPGSSAVLDQILAWDVDPASHFHGVLDQTRIGVVGHSFGGETILGLIGAHPDPSYRDTRIGSAVVLSGAVFPFQERLGEIQIPLMVMQGDVVDNEDLHGIRRRAPYEEGQGPAFYLMLRRGVHGSFFNGICSEEASVEACASAEPAARVINEYSTAFLRFFLVGDKGAGGVLRQKSPILRRFERRGW